MIYRSIFRGMSMFKSKFCWIGMFQFYWMMTQQKKKGCYWQTVLKTTWFMLYTSFKNICPHPFILVYIPSSYAAHSIRATKSLWFISFCSSPDGSLVTDGQTPDHNASVTHHADSIYSHFPVPGCQGHKKRDHISPVASVSEHKRSKH